MSSAPACTTRAAAKKSSIQRRRHARAHCHRRRGRPCPFVPPPLAARIEPLLSREEEAYRALVLGVRDYVRKNGFSSAVIALSGGIDSALTAVIAVDALGADAVTGVSMPSRYSSEGSRDDAKTLADNLGIRYLTLPIEPIFADMLEVLREPFELFPSSSTLPEENLQARIRGNLLMALSNRSGAIVLTTGNKSEMAVGYATLYGDMAGGFAVLKDVFKTFLYDLARWRNAQAGRDLIPENTIPSRPRRSCVPTSKIPIRCHPMRCWTPSCRRMSRMTARPPRL